MRGLEARGLGLERGGRRLCEAADLYFEAGQCWGILGPNGAGKTTLLHTLAGLFPAAQGQVLLDGQALAQWSRRQLAQILGVLLQDPASGFPATVLQTVLQGRHPHLSAWGWETDIDRQLAQQALEKMELVPLAQRLTDNLSGGERQRMAIATLLAQDPQYLLLDEPVNHLDLHQQIRGLDLFRRLASEAGKTVIMVLHDVNLAQRYCDHVVLMQGGGEVLSGSREAILSAENLTSLFGHRMQAVPGPHGPLFVPE